jgi:energy-coupling factor transporter ATP-binding protein EcfA2
VIRSISIEGFKSIASQTIELGRVNCFIGANGVGKSNVLEAIGLLGAAANGRVDDEALMRRGVRPGLPRLYKTAFADRDIRPHITLEAVDFGGALYRISLLNPLNDADAWRFKTEKLYDGSTDIVSVGVRTDKSNLDKTASLAALKVVELATDNPGAELLRLLQSYAIYCPNTPTLRGTVQDPQSRRPVGLAGGQLAEGFDQLQNWLKVSEDEDHLDSVLELIDWVGDVSTTEAASMLLSPSVARGQRVLQFTDRFMRAGDNTLSAYDASEGALYVIFAAMLCLSPQSPKLLAVDNLDQALNPRLLTSLTKRLIGWLRANDAERQLLFTAHNPAVLDGLDLDDEVRLFAVERNSGGHTSIRRVVLTEGQRELNKQYPLSRLWMMGVLGAIPNV